MSAILAYLSDATLDRLTTIAAESGVSVGDVIERLLDRDPHDHDHRCPTCVRLAAGERSHDPDQTSLLDVLDA